MPKGRHTHKVMHLTGVMPVILLTFGLGQAVALESTFASSPPERCAGYGDLQSISLTDWESGLGLGAWIADTRNIRNSATFDTPDWAVTGGLPDGRAGSAAFVPNLNIGNCTSDDETGVLTLTSPEIVIPGNVIIPRLSFDHWFDTQRFFDGGILRIKRNNGDYLQVPASAIEMAPYEDTLEEATDEFGFEINSNPLAGLDAWTGKYSEKPTGSWVQTRINLDGIANAGDTIRLRFEFGIDGCDGSNGWYVDDVDVYYCPFELPPSNCGNGVIDGQEACDDGNDFIGDGCSNTCQVESGWQCAAPTSSAAIPDSSFEAGTPNPFWTEVSNNPIGTPICELAVCGRGGGTGPADGAFWALFGGVSAAVEGSLSQTIVIPSTISTLSFELEIPSCDSAADYFEVLIDGNQELLIDGSSPLCGVSGYSTQTVDISEYADDAVHDLEFHSETFAVNGGRSSFFIDVVGLPGRPSICRRIGTHLTLRKDVINDDGGNALAADWTLSSSGPSSISGPGPIVSSAVTAGTYVLAESGGPAGYSASDWICKGASQLQPNSNTVIVGADEDVTCTITNNDIESTLTLFKTIINDHGGPYSDPDIFDLRIDGIIVPHNFPNIVDVGDHTVTEKLFPGFYLPGDWGGDCDAEGDITLSLGQNATCTITNDDIGLTLVKQVINDNGGNAEPADWTLSASGPFPFSGPGPSVSSPAPFQAGSYELSESTGPDGYSSGSWNCIGDGTLVGNTITLSPNESATCTIISNDISPTLTIEKIIDNSGGGTVFDPNAFGLMVDDQTVLDRVANEVDAGDHTVSEIGQPKYTPGPWGGDCDAMGNITLSVGQNATCTITNVYVPLADLSISKTDGQISTGRGGSTNYTLVVSNAGPDMVSDANVTDIFAAALDCSYSSVAVGGATGNTAGSGNIADTLVLPPGSSVTYTAPCNIDPGSAGTLSNTATVSSVVTDPNPGNNSDTDLTDLSASADLTITKSDGQTSATPGGNTTYTIVASNAGPSTVTDANVMDTFAAALDCNYTSVTAGGASGNTASGSADIADTLIMPAGSFVTYTVRCWIDPEARGLLSNTATMSSMVMDPNPGNESATDTTNLTASANLRITKTDGLTVAAPGGNSTYTIVVSNAGPSTVSDASVVDNFAADLSCTYTSVAAYGASGNTTGSGDIADTLVLPAGSSVIYTVSCDINPEATGTLSNTASVSSAVTDPIPGNESATDSTNLVASADLSISKTDGQNSVAPGSNTTYTIVVSNAGPSTVNDANVTDAFVTELDCSYTSVAANGASGNTLSGTDNIADVLTLPPGSSVTYSALCTIDPGAAGTLSNTANVSSAVTDPNPGNNSDTDFTNLTASADLTVTKSDGQTSATPGGNTTYTIVASNAGPSIVSDAYVTDTFAAALDCNYTSVAAGGATGNTAGSGNIADTLVLPPGSSVTYTAPCNIDPGAAGTLSNTATVSSVVTDPNPGNNSAIDTTDLVSSADLSISKTDGQTTAGTGGNTTYTIVASNAGPSTVTDAKVMDTFEAALDCSYTSVATGGATGNTAGTGNIADTLMLPPGSSVTYSAFCGISLDATGTLSNTATVSSVVTDPNPGNNSDTDLTNLTASADLTITKSDGQFSATPGGNTTYTIVASNAGPSLVSNANVSDTFAPELDCSYTSVAAGGATGNTAGSGNIADTLVMPPGSSVTYTALCNIDPGAAGTLSNTANVSSVVTDPNPGNNIAIDTTDLVSSADLSISKTDGQTTAAPGDNTNYTIMVSNAGPSTVSDASVTDTFATELGCTYSSEAAGGASGNTAAGSGDIGDTLVLPPGSSVTYTALCDIDPESTGTLSNTATVSSAVNDPNPGDESATDTNNLVASANLSINKTDGQASAAPGGTATYTIVVSNAGPSTVSDASVTDTFVPELDCSYTSLVTGGASGNTASGTGDIGDTLVLPPDSSVTYTVPCDIDTIATGTLSNTAAVNSAINDPNPGDESATDTNSLIASADLSISNTDGQASATPGGSTTYNIIVNNAGPSTVSDASVTDTFAPELDCTYTSEATGGASGNTVSDSGDIDDTLMLLPGSSVTYTVSCDIDPAATGTLSNTASVSTAVADPNPGNESATDTNNLVASANLSISKTDGRTAVTPGRSTTYTIVVSNAGPSTVSDASVTDTFAAELDCTFTSEAAGGASGNMTAGSGDITDSLVLPPDSSVIYTVPCDIDPEATGTLSNTASVNSAIDDPNPGDESDTDTNNLTATANLSITKNDGRDQVTPGSSTSYTLLVSNAGPSTVSDANITDTFAVKLDCTYTSEATGGASGNTASGNGDIDDILVLPPESSVTYTVPCDIDPAATGTLSNTASVSSATIDTSPGNESATDTSELGASADLSISKTDGEVTVAPGGSTTYTIVVSNAGPSTVSDANVTDTFAAELDCTYTSQAAGGASGNTDSGSGDIADTLVLPPDSSVTYTVPCEIDATAAGTLSNTATVSSTIDDTNPGDESATDASELVAVADLWVSKTDELDEVAPGGTTTYTIVVGNAGPSTVSDANVTDTFVAELNCTYTSEAAGGASGNTPSGSGDIEDTLELPSGSSVTYTASCDIDPGATGIISNTASVSSAVNDPNPGDESMTDNNSILGDAVFRDGFESN